MHLPMTADLDRPRLVEICGLLTRNCDGLPGHDDRTHLRLRQMPKRPKQLKRLELCATAAPAAAENCSDDVALLLLLLLKVQHTVENSVSDFTLFVNCRPKFLDASENAVPMTAVCCSLQSSLALLHNPS